MQPPGQQSARQKPKRPTGVTAVGVIAILGGILGLLGALPVLLASPTQLEMVLGIIVVIFAILGFAVGGGVLTRTGTMIWKFAIGVYIISIPLGLFEIYAGGMTGLIGGIIRTVVGIIFVYYLMRPNVKSYFGDAATMSK